MTTKALGRRVLRGGQENNNNAHQISGLMECKENHRHYFTFSSRCEGNAALVSSCRYVCEAARVSSAARVSKFYVYVKIMHCVCFAEQAASWE